MSAASSGILSWSPLDQTEAEPCGGEHLHGLVFPSTPISSARMPPRKIRPPRLAAEVSVIQDLLEAQSDTVLARMEALMHKQEQRIARLLGGHSREDVPCKGTLFRSHSDDKVAKINATMDVEAKECDKDRPLKEQSSEFVGTASVMRPYSRNHQTLDRTAAELLFTAVMNGKCLPSAPTLPPHRQFFQKLLSTPLYDAAMAATIIINAIVIVIECDSNAKCDVEDDGCVLSWAFAVNSVLLGIYTVESVIVVDVYRWSIFKRKTRLFEILIVAIGYFVLIVHVFGDKLPNVGALKLIRLSRVLRGFRLFHFFHELNFIMTGFASAMRAMIWGYFMMIIILIVVGIVAVELLNPQNKSVTHDTQYCSEVFDSVWNAMIWMFQTTLAGDSWGHCSIPIIKHAPITAIFFAGVLTALQVGFLNLIMSVIIDRVADAHQKDTTARLTQKERDMRSTLKKWFDMFDKLDRDADGQLTEEELLKGFDTVPDFSSDLKLLGIDKVDIPNFISLIDVDKNKRVSVDELFSLLNMVVNFDGKMHQIMMGLELRMIGQRLESRMKRLQGV